MIDDKAHTFFFSAVLLGAFLIGCDDGPAGGGAPGGNPEAADFILPSVIPMPAGNDATPERIELGRLLFWDPILAGELDIACATCHHPSLAYADARGLPLGTASVGLGTNRRSVSGGRIPVVGRNSPTILNTGFLGLESVNQQLVPEEAPIFWDARARGLETQPVAPLESRDEMRGDAYAEAVAVDSVLARLTAIPEYVALFREAFGDGPITADTYSRAIAAFERSIVLEGSRFDRWALGDLAALTDQEVAGFRAFIDVGCVACHSGPMFSDFSLHRIGTPDHPERGGPDEGDGNFGFRTPSLRNVALTAPYTHGGAFPSLLDVLGFYERRVSANPLVTELDLDFLALDRLDVGTTADITAFLRALTDLGVDNRIPDSVPSGLPPGGAIQ